MMSRNFRLSSEFTGAIAKILPHAKNQLSAPGSFFNQFVTYLIYMYTIYTHINRVLIVRTSALRLLALRGWRRFRFRRWLPLFPEGDIG